MKNYINLLWNTYREVQNYGKTLANGWIPNALFMTIFSVLILFPLPLSIKIAGFTLPDWFFPVHIVWMIVIGCLSVLYLEYRQRNLYKFLRIKTEKYIFDQTAIDLYWEFRLDLFYKSCCQNKILSGNGKSDILEIQKLRFYLEKEKRYWYTEPKLYLGVIFTFLSGALWSKTLDVLIDSVAVEKQPDRLWSCYGLFIILFVACVFIVALYNHYLKRLNQKSENYKTLIRYLDQLLMNLERETKGLRSNHSDQR